MKEIFFEHLPPEEKKRMAFIEERPDLFETKVLEIVDLQERKDDAIEKKNIVVATRDPGSGNALLPVLQELMKDKDTRIIVITDGRAQEIIQNNFFTKDVTPRDTALASADVVRKPQAILMDLSSGEIGLDTYVSAAFPDVPKVLVEDYYTTAREFLLELQRRKLPWPEKICVMDQGAKDIVVATGYIRGKHRH